MIFSADEFKLLRLSNDVRASHDEASVSVWFDVIRLYPELKSWVIHNKTIPYEVLEHLAGDLDNDIRGHVARKRKIHKTPIFDLLALDKSEDVRHSLAWNTKNTIEDVEKIRTEDSDWLTEELNEIKKNKKT